MTHQVITYSRNFRGPTDSSPPLDGQPVQSYRLRELERRLKARGFVLPANSRKDDLVDLYEIEFFKQQSAAKLAGRKALGEVDLAV